VLAPWLLAGEGRSINQRLRSNKDLPKALAKSPPTGHSARTIHSVKGMEFPAVCVVLSTKTAKGILEYLSGSGGADSEEEARKIYVGASRAQRLLAIATPKSQATRLVELLQSTGADVLLSTV